MPNRVIRVIRAITSIITKPSRVAAGDLFDAQTHLVGLNGEVV